MGISNSIKNTMGVLTVQIEGFFTERFINLCKINNVKIWDIRNLVSGVVRFKIYIGDFKKIKPFVRKTKCRVKIKNKEGLYFTFFKYRKRRFFIYLLIATILAVMTFSSFIWKINITGNEKIANDIILKELKESNLYIGKCKIGLDTKKIVKQMRVGVDDLAWIGISINGTTADVSVVEKVEVAEENVNNKTAPGDIFASKTGLITKIIPENGTAKFKENSYVDKDCMLIEGVINSKVMDPKVVRAKGIVMADCEYIFEKEYSYEQMVKEYDKKSLWTIGFFVDNKEFMFNYLKKDRKYDITITKNTVNIFGKEISFARYNCHGYVEKNVNYTRDELLEQARKDLENYINNTILINTKNGSVKAQSESFIEKDGKILYKNIITINEEIGIFKER